MSERILRAALAAAATVAGSASAASAAVFTAVPGVTVGVSDLTALTTRAASAAAPSTTDVSGRGGGYSPFKPTDSYTVTYTGAVEQVTTATAGGVTYAAGGQATVDVRRFQGADTDHVWYAGSESGTGNGSVLTLDGPRAAGVAQALAGNNLDEGADNLFSTRTTGPTANPVGDNTNVDRVDLVFAGGLAASASSAFVIADRGDPTDHDAFTVAAITALDAHGDPAAYGPLLRFDTGTWGTTAVAAATREEILRQTDPGTADPLHPADHVDQALGGVAVTTAALAHGAAVLYGYSIFSPDLTVTGDGSGTQLVNYQDAAVYGLADSTTGGGGLDPADTVGVLFTAQPAVPEPASVAMVIVAGGLVLGRRRRARAWERSRLNTGR